MGGGRREGNGGEGGRGRGEGAGDAPSLDGAGQVDAESVCAESHKGSPLKQLDVQQDTSSPGTACFALSCAVFTCKRQSKEGTVFTKIIST